MPAVSESKASRRARPVKTASGEILEAAEPTPERRWWLLIGVPILVVVIAAAAGLQWRFDWVHGLPHSNTASETSAIDIPMQPVAAAIAAPATFAPISESAVAKALAPYITGAAKKSFGPHLDVLVTGFTGSATFTSSSTPITPASILKTLTAVSALDVLGPNKRFTTSVRLTGANTIAIVGGGDPYLATSPGTAGTYPQPANLTDLARKTAAYLKAHHLRRVALTYDNSLFSGPALDPSWEPDYFSSGVIAPISALWTNEGKLDDGALSANPALTAAQVFAGLLQGRGIAVMGTPTATTAATSPTIASVTSAPLVQELDETLGESDNFAAEVIARHVAIGTGNPASFSGAVTAITQTLIKLGIPITGLQMHDGSGLSRHDRLEPETLAAIFRLAATTPRLSGLLGDLPVAGFSGTLNYRFQMTPAKALGLVRAKTGTLTSVNSMAGFAVDATGTPLIFVAVGDRTSGPNTLEARALLDSIGAALTTCRCSEH